MFTLTYRTHQGKEYQISTIDRTYIYQMFAAVIQAIDCSYAAVTDGFTRKFCSMTAMLGLTYCPVKAATIQVLRNEVDDMLLVRSARNGVDNEYYLGLFLHILRCKGITFNS